MGLGSLTSEVIGEEAGLAASAEVEDVRWPWSELEMGDGNDNRKEETQGCDPKTLASDEERLGLMIFLCNAGSNAE